jgi:hypothetical protein
MQVLTDNAHAAEWLELAPGNLPTATGYKQAAKTFQLMPLSKILAVCDTATPQTDHAPTARPS